MDTKHHTVHLENDSMRFCNCCSLVYRVLDFMIDFGLVMICMASRLDLGATCSCSLRNCWVSPHNTVRRFVLPLSLTRRLK